MIKKYCDVCKKEVQTVKEYTLPVRDKQSVKDSKGNTILLTVTDCISSKNLDLCHSCESMLAEFIKNYSYVMTNKE